MEHTDSVKLLKECDAGSKMAVASIDDVLEKVTNSELKDLLQESKEHHEDPNPVAKGMSWMKTNMKLGMDDSDATVADLITDGCNMGVKSLHKYLNKYQAADDTSKDICNRLVSIEETLCKDLRKYL